MPARGSQHRCLTASVVAPARLAAPHSALRAAHLYCDTEAPAAVGESRRGCRRGARLGRRRRPRTPARAGRASARAGSCAAPGCPQAQGPRAQSRGELRPAPVAAWSRRPSCGRGERAATGAAAPRVLFLAGGAATFKWGSFAVRGRQLARGRRRSRAVRPPSHVPVVSDHRSSQHPSYAPSCGVS